MVRAAEIMARDVAVVRQDDVVADVVHLFVQRNVTSAVVVDEKKRRQRHNHRRRHHGRRPATPPGGGGLF